MGTKRVGLARTQALIQNLKRELTMGGATLTGQKQRFLLKTANYTVVQADGGGVIQVKPADTTLIQLPSAATVGAGWSIDIIVNQDDGGTLDQKVNIGTASGEFFNGIIIGGDAGGSLIANGTSNDFITLTASAKSGERFTIVSDGTRMHATGWAYDVSHTAFANAAG